MYDFIVHILALIEFYKSSLVDLLISWVPDQIDFVCFFLIADKDSLPCSFGKLCSLFFWDQHPGRAAKYPQVPRFRLLVPPKLPWALSHIRPSCVCLECLSLVKTSAPHRPLLQE